MAQSANPTGSARMAAAEVRVKAAFRIFDSRIAQLKSAHALIPSSTASAGRLIVRMSERAKLGDPLAQAKDASAQLHTAVKVALDDFIAIEQDGIKLLSVAACLKGDAPLPDGLDAATLAAVQTLRGTPGAPSVARAMETSVRANVTEAKRLHDLYADRVKSAADLTSAKGYSVVAKLYGNKRTAEAAQRLADWRYKKHAEKFNNRRTG